MFRKIFTKFLSIFNSSNKDDIKNVLEDLIDENTNGSEEIDDGTKNIFKNVINLSDKCLEDVMIPRADIAAVQNNVKINDLINFFLTSVIEN